MSPEVIAALGAFLTGAGSVLSAIVAIHFERKNARRECEERINALLKGYEMGHEKSIE